MPRHAQMHCQGFNTFQECWQAESQGLQLQLHATRTECTILRQQMSEMNREMERLRQDNSVLSVYATSILSTATNILNGRVERTEGMEAGILSIGTNLSINGVEDKGRPSSYAASILPQVSTMRDSSIPPSETPPLQTTPPPIILRPVPTLPPTPKRGQRALYWSHDERSWREAPEAP